jgi:hypothetical protein
MWVFQLFSSFPRFFFFIQSGTSLFYSHSPSKKFFWFLCLLSLVFMAFCNLWDHLLKTNLSCLSLN